MTIQEESEEKRGGRDDKKEWETNRGAHEKIREKRIQKREWRKKRKKKREKNTEIDCRELFDC